MSDLINRDKLKEVLTNNGYGGTKFFEVIDDVPADDTIDRIRAEISDNCKDAFYPDDVMMSKRMVLGIIDKYRKGASE